MKPSAGQLGENYLQIMTDNEWETLVTAFELCYAIKS